MTIGEEEPILPDGTCEELSFTTGDGKTCHFTGRNDIFRHLLLTGGWHGSKETVKQLTTRVFSFINYYMDKVNEPRIKALFETQEYKDKIGNICRDGWAAQGKPHDGEVYFRPTQVNIVLLPPGFDLALHQDNQWFWGINQMSVPDWLLHVIKESELYDDVMIPQAQGVAYLHGTRENPYFTNGGRYVFYPNGPGAPAKSLPPKRGQAIMMDGGRMIHGVERTGPGYHSAHMIKGHFNRVEYQGNDTWYVMANDDLVDVFKTEEFRMTFVWRSLCFRSENEKIEFDRHIEKEEFIPHEEIFEKLEIDLRKRGKLGEKEGIKTMGPKAFAKLLQHVYMQYPLDVPDAWFPFNYCALGFVNPWLETMLSPFCLDLKEKVRLNDQFPPAKKFCDPLNRTRRHTNCPEGYQGE